MWKMVQSHCGIISYVLTLWDKYLHKMTSLQQSSDDAPHAWKGFTFRSYENLSIKITFFVCAYFGLWSSFYGLYPLRLLRRYSLESLIRNVLKIFFFLATTKIILLGRFTFLLTDPFSHKARGLSEVVEQSFIYVYSDFNTRNSNYSFQ